ncbi:MAG: MarC family protein [Candidatus Woesearchaeota archaeon]
MDISLIIQIFVLLNPLSSFPFLISAYERKMNLKIITIKAVLTAFIIAVIMALIGPILFSIFGITINTFRIAGGIVLFLLALDMVRPHEKEKSDYRNIDSLITIIATPMLTGPATISFITLKTIELGKFVVLANLPWAFLLVGLVFFIFSLLVSKVDPKIVNMLSRILGLFLLAISIEMISNGIFGLINFK